MVRLYQDERHHGNRTYKQNIIIIHFNINLNKMRMNVFDKPYTASSLIVVARTDGAARAETNLFGLCRVASEDEQCSEQRSKARDYFNLKKSRWLLLMLFALLVGG